MKANSIEWLLEKNDPSVRYFTLTDILERPEDDSKVIKAKEEIMETGLVPKILAKQEHGGYWESPRIFTSDLSTRVLFGSS